MQVDNVPEENENVEVEHHIVENTNLVREKLRFFRPSCSLIRQLHYFNLQDLETYAASYKGLAKLYRLLFVVEHCPPLRVEALRMALSYVMTTFNTNMYQQIHKSLQDAITGSVSPCAFPVLGLLLLSNISLVFSAGSPFCQMP